ncbi:hypothetical protein BROC_00440 [Candidatus Brocadiaceae bacterium]|nr:hypothetical protein [Candidatus Dojkabacteria bacterium]CAG0938976.1 hypothetical protein BROC_00440 [Candidatus Brocadiaceae bacterium]
MTDDIPNIPLDDNGIPQVSPEVKKDLESALESALNGKPAIFGPYLFSNIVYSYKEGEDKYYSDSGRLIYPITEYWVYLDSRDGIMYDIVPIKDRLNL